jgi:frataxin-like iron-binding protein CyaY
MPSGARVRRVGISRVTSLVALVGVLFYAAGAQAQRRYPITKTDATGAWIGTKRGLLNGRGELWQPFLSPKSLPSNHVTDVELSPRDVWVTTTAGLARLNKGSRRWDTYTAPQLPSSQTTAVSLDPSDPFQVWIGTRAGLAHFNVRTNRWRTFAKGSGLPSLVVNDVFVRGRTVWAATDAGLAAYDVKLGTWKIYRKRDGIAGSAAPTTARARPSQTRA